MFIHYVASKRLELVEYVCVCLSVCMNAFIHVTAYRVCMQVYSVYTVTYRMTYDAHACHYGCVLGMHVSLHYCICVCMNICGFVVCECISCVCMLVAVFSLLSLGQGALINILQALSVLDAELREWDAG